MADFLRDVERDARLKRMSAMLPPGEITLRNALALIDDVKAYCELHSIPQSRLADSIGTTASYVSTVFTKSEQLFQSNPPLNCKTRDKLLRAMASFMEEHARQARPATGKVIPTGVFELILGGPRTVKAKGMIGSVTAPAGPCREASAVGR